MNIFIVLQYLLTYIIVPCLCIEQFQNKELVDACSDGIPEPLLISDNKEHVWDISNYNKPEALIIKTIEGSEFEINYSILIEIKELDLDSENGDYLLIKGGENADLGSSNGRIFTYMLKKARKYLFHSNSVSISLHVCDPKKAKKRVSQKKVLLTYQRIGEDPLSTTETPSTSVAWPTPSPEESNYFIGNISGKTAFNFTIQSNIDDFKNAFKNAMVGSSQEYCNSHKVELTEEITIKNVLIHHIIQCPYSWPNSHLCMQVNFSLPIRYKENLEWTGYQMNSERLADMWINYAGSFLEKHNMEIYSVPNNTASYMKWIAISCSILTVLLIFPCIVNAVTKKLSPAKNTGLPIPITDLKSNQPSLPQSPYQHTPPIFEDEDYFDVFDYEIPKPKHVGDMDWLTDDVSDDEINHFNRNIRDNVNKDVNKSEWTTFE